VLGRWLACLLLAWLVAACGAKKDEGVGGCAMPTADGLTAVPPDAPFTVRYEAVRDAVRALDAPGLEAAASCAEGSTHSSRCKPASAEQRVWCLQTTADEGTCAWASQLPSRNPYYRSDLEEGCRCLRFDVESCGTAIRAGEQQAALAILRRREHRGYVSACLAGTVRSCWWLVRESFGYPVDGPDVTAWKARVFALGLVPELRRERAPAPRDGRMHDHPDGSVVVPPGVGRTPCIRGRGVVRYVAAATTQVIPPVPAAAWSLDVVLCHRRGRHAASGHWRRGTMKKQSPFEPPKGKRKTTLGKPPTATAFRHNREKQVPGHHVQVDVKFLTLQGAQGQRIRRYHYTAIDDATRVRALKVYRESPDVKKMGELVSGKSGAAST
jgi:hypothetical protein